MSDAIDTSRDLRIFRANAYYIPIKDISKKTQQRLLNKFTYKFYEERACNKCENLDERHNDICDACPSYLGTKQTAKVDVVGNKEFLSIPRGGKDRMLDILDRAGYESITIKKRSPPPTPFRRAIRFTGKLHDYQGPAINTCIKKRMGILKSPPRSGKTVMATALVCKVGLKTLILAHQTEWLSQFRETFLGSDTQKGFTDARPHQVNICKTFEQFQETDVCLATFSTFMSDKGKALLRKIRNLFNVVIIDEVQGVPAKESSRVTAQFNFDILLGLSGTPARKRSEEWQLADDLIGPILVETQVPRLRPKVDILPTIKKEFKASAGQAGLTFLQSRLESDKARRNIIINDIIKRAKAGHLVLVPMTRVASILAWTREINERMEQVGYALPFYGGLKKEMRMRIVEKARKFRCRVVVGNIALLSTGLNIPRASCLYEIGVNNNIPKAGQRFARILTPMDDKPTPVIVFTMDNCDIMRRCRQNEFWNCLIKDFNPDILPEVKRDLLSYFANTKRRQAEMDNSFLREGL